VLTHTSMAPGEIEQEEHTNAIQPRGWLRPVNFKIAAVGAGVVQSNFEHLKNRS